MRNSPQSQKKRAFIVNQRSNCVSAIETSTYTVSATIEVGENPTAIALTPDGQTAIVTQWPESISLIDLQTYQTSTHSVGALPQSLAITPDGALAFVGNYYGESVSIVDVTCGQVIATLPIKGYVDTVAVGPEGEFAIALSQYGQSVTLIDIDTRESIHTFTTLGAPTAVVLLP